MTIVIIGKGGQLGDTFTSLLRGRGEAVRQLDQERVDLARPESVQLDFDGVDLVVNCAAYTNVDGAETDEETARRVNGYSVGAIARQCAQRGVPLIHYSTDYVFDGRGTAPYRTDHPRAPLGAYGRTKALGEELLEDSGADYLLVRTSWVYAPFGNNFVRTIARLCREKDELKVVSDQRGCPTHALTLAERSFDLFRQGKRGTFHVTDAGECSWFEFACAIRDICRADCHITPCTTAEFPRPAPRPAYSVLDTSETEAVLGPAVGFRTRLEEMAQVLRGL